MIKSVLQTFFSIFLVSMVMSGGICAVFSSHDRPSVCQKSNFLNNGADGSASQSCKVLPCNLGRFSVFIPTFFPASLNERTDQHNSNTCDSHLMFKTHIFHGFSLQSGSYHLNFFIYDQPPSFIMNCAFLC
jgi:hypothetical protein